MSVLKKLASDTALYGVSSILGRLLYWLLVFVHTRVFDQPRLLADNNQLYTYVVVLNVLYTYGMETAFFRYASKEENRRDYYNLILSAIITSSVVLSGIFILFASQIINTLGYPGKERLIVWLAIILATDAAAAIPFAKLRIEKRAKKFVAIKMANIFINIGLNVFYLMFCKSIHDGRFLTNWKPLADFFYNPRIGPDYIIWANFIANLVMIILLWREFIDFRFRFNFPKFKTVWIYAYPLFIMGLAGTINITADRQLFRYILPEGFYSGFSTDDAFSIYANVYKLSIFMTVVVQAFRYAADPFFFSKAEDKDAKPIFADVTKWFIIACSLIWVGVSLNLDVLGLFLGKNYRSGIVVVPWLLLANLFIGVYGNLAVWFKLSDKTGYGTLITFIGMTLTVLLNIILIPRMGYMGCAITFTFSSLVMCVICYVLGQKYYPIPYSLESAGFYIGSAAVLIIVSSQIHIKNIYLAAPFHLILCLCFVGIIVFKERKFLGLERYFPRMKIR
jgi:O-antigen/teichoic acid export membrane protein